jgi:nitroimidazol reductase NimA-like FMN-containing flavoprotein (pyridoxamine 5'-phosphate oxidase superfamily)
MSEQGLSGTPRTELRRLRERGRTDRDDLYAVLDTALICHVGVLAGGAPRVLPTAYGRRGDTLYLHGSTANATYMAADGQEICVTVTHLDGIVCARSVFHHSMNYRSAMIYGTARRVIDDDEHLLALELITEHLTPGQWSYVRPPTKKELAATTVLALPLGEASVKMRTGDPSDDEEDYATDVWAGVVPVSVVFGDPVPDAALRPGIEAPQHILRYRE